MSTITCPSCGARFTLASEIPAGKRLHCRKCGTSFAAGEEPAGDSDASDALEAAESEAAAPSEERRSRTPRAAEPRAKALSPLSVVIALVLVGAGGAIGFLARGDAAPAAPASGTTGAEAPAGAGASAAPPPSAPSGPAAPSADELAFLEMAAKASSAAEHAAAGKFAKEKGLKPEWVDRQWEWAIVHDADNAEARAALGHTLYDGPVKWAKEKRWLAAADLEKAKGEQAALEAEAAKLAAERASDPWLAQVDKIMSVIRGGSANQYLAGINFRVSEEYRPYLILIEDARDFHFKQIGEALTQFYANFQDTWGKKLSLKPVERPLVILAFKSADGYDKFSESIAGGGAGGRKLSETTAGIFYPTVGATVPGQGFVKIAPTMIYGRGSDSYPYREVINSGVFTHEATHQLQDYYTSLDSVERSHWFTEGFAEYSGSLIYHQKSQKYKFNDFLTHRDLEFRNTLKDKKGLTWTLEEILTIPGKAAMEQRAKEKAEASGDLSKRDALQSLFYAQAWYWIWYCKKGPRAAELWPKFEKYVAAEFEGRSGPALFQEIFSLKIDEALEKEYLEFVQKPLLDKPKEEEKEEDAGDGK